MDNAELTTLIKSAASRRSLPWELVYAICQVESSLNPSAIRHEPHYRWLVGDNETMSPTERQDQMTSWGLMQVMGDVARELGHTGTLSELLDPHTGLFYGCLHLRRFRAKYDIWPGVIAAYNAGSPRRVAGQIGPYVNQSYVDKEIGRAHV